MIKIEANSGKQNISIVKKFEVMSAIDEKENCCDMETPIPNNNQKDEGLDITTNRRRKEKKNRTERITKIIVRHLPPTMTETDFLEQVFPLPPYDLCYYCPADWSLGEEATCRAYIWLKSIEGAIEFRDRFDGYVFVDSKGAEYMAVVEYAPFQCFLKNKAKYDNKVNTIHSEPHFQDFLRKLANEQDEASRLGDMKIDFGYDDRTEEKVISTPLLQYLANKKEKRREEARKRSEEKRKQREEQKKLRQTDQLDKTNCENKTISKGNVNCSGKNLEKDNLEELTKMSRAKRRSERDQRRREEHERRKLKRELRDKGEKIGKNIASKISLKQGKQFCEDKKKSEVTNSVHEKNINVDESNEIERDINDTMKDLEKSTINEKKDDTKKPNPTCKSKMERSSEEKRIRNKDRPSIAIYQPKPRLCLKDSKDEAAKNEMHASTSDTEACTKEELKTKTEKYNRSRPLENSNERRVSKSSESSASANSKT